MAERLTSADFLAVIFLADGHEGSCDYPVEVVAPTSFRRVISPGNRSSPR